MRRAGSCPFAPSGAALFSLAVVLVLGAASARAKEAPAPSDGGVAPPGCWTMEDGCAARTGATATPGVRGPLLEAWSIDLGPGEATIEQEPLVWHDRIVVCVRRAGSLRTLHVLRLGNGRPLAPALRLSTSKPLEASLWGETILVRDHPNRLGAYRLRRGKLAKFWEATAPGAITSPLLIDGQVFALDGEDVVCWTLGRSEPAWRKSGRYRGRLAVRGGDVLVLSSDEVGNLSLAPISRDVGAAGREVFVGNYRGKGVPRTSIRPRISAHDGNVFVQHDRDLRTKGSAPFRTSWLRRYALAGRRTHYDQKGILDYTCLAVAAGDRWLVTEPDAKAGHQLKLSMNDEKDAGRTQGYILAAGKRHEAFHRLRVPFTVAGEVAYAGGRAFDWKTRHIVWDAGRTFRFRPVPATQALLVVPSAGRLTALRPKEAIGLSGTYLGPAHDVGLGSGGAPRRVQGVVFLEDDTAHEGDYEISADGKTVTLIKKKGKRERREEQAIERVLFLLDDQSRLLHSSSAAELERALQRYHFFRHADVYYKLAKDAYKTSDPELMGRLIAEAAARGISDKRLKFPRKQQKALVDRPRKKNAKRCAALVKKVAALEAEDAALIRTTLESPLDDPRWPIQQSFARRVLAADPTHAKAAERVRARLPSFFDVPQDFDPLVWIDLVDQLQHTAVVRLAAPVAETKDLTHLQREYGQALGTWRNDLVALKGEQLLIFTPLARPGRIAGCLATGSLVCRALEDVFGAGEHVRSDPWPLILHLYETKEAFVAKAAPRGAPAAKRKRVERLAGHYDPNAGVSRVFLPARSDAWASVMETYAHELTHHWLEERCPLFKSAELKRRPRQPGFWIVEGMATFLEQFRWNLEQQTWDARNATANSLDVVANATPKQLHPWRLLFGLNQDDFHKLGLSDTKRKIPMRWRLGYSHLVSDTRMFYDQAAAACHCLYHSDPALRAKLLEYVKAYYTGKLKPQPDSIQSIFGMTADELGRRVVQFARASIQGG